MGSFQLPKISFSSEISYTSIKYFSMNPIKSLLRQFEKKTLFNCVVGWLKGSVAAGGLLTQSRTFYSKNHVVDFTFLVRRINVNRHTPSAYVFLL
jgi:hypothetical protein